MPPVGYHLSSEVTPFSILKVLDPGGAASLRDFAKCACLGDHARDGPPSQQEGRGEPTDSASIEGSRELHFPVPLGQAAMALSCLTISYLLRWGPGLKFSSDGTSLHISSSTRRTEVGPQGSL